MLHTLSLSSAQLSARFGSHRIGSAHLVESSHARCVGVDAGFALCSARLELRATTPSPRLPVYPSTRPPDSLPLSDNGPIHYCACLASFAAHFIKMAFKTIIQALKLYLHSLQSLFNLLLRFEVAPLSRSLPASSFVFLLLLLFLSLRPVEAAPKRAQLTFMSRKALVVMQKRDLSFRALLQLNLVRANVMINPETDDISLKKTEP